MSLSANPLTTSYTTHRRPSCIGARAGFGDLLIGAGALMIRANGLDPDRHGYIREAMADLITITESFYACGVASLVYCVKDPAGSVMPDAVFSNIGKLLLATKICDMYKVAHYVLGGLIVALPGPDEDHNPETAALLSDVLGGRADIPMERRMEVARFIEDITASNQGGWYSVISLHGGGSLEAMKREIWRNYPVMEKVELVESLLDHGQPASKQPGRCCATGCEVPTLPTALGEAPLGRRVTRHARCEWNCRGSAGPSVYAHFCAQHAGFGQRFETVYGRRR